MNAKIYHASIYEFFDSDRREKGSFEDRIISNLHHLVVVDCLWLQRFTQHSANYEILESISYPELTGNLNQILFDDDLSRLQDQRMFLDKVISELAHAITRLDLDFQLSYTTTKGNIVKEQFFSILMFFFNYQTNLREKTLELFSQTGIIIDATELVVPRPSGIEI